MRKAAPLLSILPFLFAASGVIAQDADPKTVPLAPTFEVKNAQDCPEGTQNCKLVCKSFPPPTGTRLGGHTECRTQHWWDDRMREDQATTVKIQENSYKQVRPGDGG